MQENLEEDFTDKNKVENKFKKAGESVWELAKVILISLAIIVPIRTFIFQPFFVQGASMEPNFHDGEYLIINEFGYKKTVLGTKDKKLFTVEPFKEISRKNIIVFRNPQNPKEYFIKRVIGLPGEKIEIKNGDVVVYNDENPEGGILDESDYLDKMLHKTECWDECVFDIGEGHYLVLGDNRKYSSDSRAWGLLSEDFIIGKVFIRAWPFSEAEIF
jgi:signal peptidase I